MDNETLVLMLGVREIIQNTGYQNNLQIFFHISIRFNTSILNSDTSISFSVLACTNVCRRMNTEQVDCLVAKGVTDKRSDAAETARQKYLNPFANES